MFCIVFFTLFMFSNHLGAAAVESAVALHQRLPGLDDETMQATFGTSRYHSATMKSNIGFFHARGDEWTAEELKEYFLTGIFQYYAHELCGLDMTFNYEAPSELVMPDEYNEKLKRISKDVLSIESDETKIGNNIVKLLNVSVQALKSNPIFVGFGICFHRNKVILEKAQENLRYIPETPAGVIRREAVLREIIKIDRLAIDQQTAFYHWMKEVLESSVGYIKTTYETSGVLPALDDKDLLAICRHEPEFLGWPVYKELLPLALAEAL